MYRTIQLGSIGGLLIIIGWPFLHSCTKSDSKEGQNPQQHSITDTVRRIYIQPLNYAQGYDTSANFIAYYSFSRHRTGSNYAWYTASSSGTYRIRYVGGEMLFHPDSVISRGGDAVWFKLNPALKGKVVFEACETTTNKLYRKYVAAPDSVLIDVSFSIWDNYVTPTRKIGEAMNYYVQHKQTDDIVYWKGN